MRSCIIQRTIESLDWADINTGRAKKAYP